MKTRRHPLLIVCLLVSFFSFSIAGFLLLRRYSSFPIDFQLTGQVRAEEFADRNLPVQLVIPSQRIDLPIIPVELKNDQWQLTNHGVSLLQSSLPANGERGYILYGHNWRSLLGSLHEAKTGETISLQYADGNIDNYTIDEILTVSPSRLDVLDMAKPGSLLIYTCSGFLDSQRLVVLAHR